VPAALLPAQAAGALARAGFSRWATYRQAALAGMFTNTVFGIIKLSVLLAVIDETGGTVAGYDHASLSTYVWVSQGLISVVYVFGWSALETSRSTWRALSTSSSAGSPRTSDVRPMPLGRGLSCR